MSQLHCIKKRKPGQHITLKDRESLEYIYNENLKKPKKQRKTQKKLAEILGWSQATLSRELRRGLVKQLNSQLENYWIYSSIVAQEYVESRWESKGPQLKIGNDLELANQIEDMLLGEELEGIEPLRYSPEAIVMKFEQEGWPTETRLSARTIYNYVEKDVFLNVTLNDLPRKGVKAKKSNKRIGKRLKDPKRKRIEDRPKEAELRLEPGHWEMDCIESVKSDKTCLLTMIDRVKRECLLFKIGNQTQEAVLRRINGLERKLGSEEFKKKFKSITVDNGTEFLDWKALEKCVFNNSQRTSIYYCNAYSSWERGSNENLNGFIRYFIPKGTKLKNIKEQEIKRLEEFINKYPRKILDGQSAENFHQAAA